VKQKPPAAEPGDESKRPMPHVVEIQVDEAFNAQVQPDLLRQAALAALAYQQATQLCELAVVVTDDEALRELDRRYRDVDAPTDVLAFPNEARGPFVNAPGILHYLGDVIISFPRAVGQAAEAGHSVEAELQLLVVHGVLHLLGYDDEAEPQRARMWRAQAAILQALGVQVHLPA
jgi:probable rRNA maturation factor